MPDLDQNPLRSQSYFSYILLAGVVFVGIFLWMGVSIFKSDEVKKKKLAEQLQAEKLAEKQQEEDERLAQDEARRSSIIQSRKANWTRFGKKNEEFMILLAESDTLNQKRAALEAELLDTPKGAFLVNDPAELIVFSGMQERFGGTKSQIDQWQITAASNDATLSQMLAFSAPQSDVSPEEFSKVTGFVEQLRKLNSELVAANKYLETLSTRGSAITISPVQGTPGTLRDAIVKHNADTLAQIVKKRQDELQALADQEEQKTIELLKSQELARKENERKLLQNQFELEMKQKELEAEKQRLDLQTKNDEQTLKNKFAEEDKAMEADRVKIESLLAPFISKAKTEFLTTGYTAIRDEEKPISLSALQGFGALEPTEAGYNKLIHAAGSAIENDLRPLGGFSLDIFNLTKAAEAQRLLRVHGAAMVRAGLLEK